jgi:hypothetical protein
MQRKTFGGRCCKMRVLLFGLLLLIASCQTFTLSDGRKYRQFAPAKDRISPNEFDTSKFARLPFNLTDYTERRAHHNNKRVIVPLRAADMRILEATKDEYCLYFWNATCSGTAPAIHKMDSLSKSGKNVLIVSLREDCDVIDNVLSQTNFAQYPYYVLESRNYSKVLLLRQRDFIREACSTCYEKYKDEVIFTNYFIVQNGTMELRFN